MAIIHKPGAITGLHNPNTWDYNAAQHQSSTILRHIQDDIRGLRQELERVTAFYNWMIHAYPETIAQYKALKDLEAAARSQDGDERLGSASNG